MPWPWSTGPGRGAARLDAWLPPGAWKLEHHAIEVEAEPARALAAMHGVLPLRDAPVVAALFALRGIAFRREMTVREFFGTSPFLVLDEAPGRELVFGVVGPSRERRGERGPPGVPSSPDDFRAALAAGRMAAIGNFRAEPIPGGARLWTETWMFAPGRIERAAFTAYWLLVGPFSAWIRRILLRAAARRLRDGAARTDAGGR
ncbi:MAG TPA: hypothetical protein VFL83_19315 [Anaeromyxobacter sp.]|nr:hypothetical protein [Anaeromyxobacter sp.]